MDPQGKSTAIIYLSVLKAYKDTWGDDLREAALDIVGSSIDSLKQRFGMDALADWVLGKLLKDMAFYYDDNRQIKKPVSSDSIFFENSCVVCCGV